MEDQDLENFSRKEILAAAYSNSAFAAKLFFPDRFHREFDRIHHKIFDVIDNTEAQRVAIAVPRGLGKSSINNLLLPAKNILFRDSNYVVPVSSSATQAEMQSENLKEKLLSNPKIRHWFGDLETDNFSKEQYVVDVLGEKICVMPRGAGQQIRGILYRDHRPDLIIVDDLEDPDDPENYTERQRQKIKNWFFGDLVNSVDRGSDDWRIIVLGTILHPDSLLVNLLNSSKWHSVEIPICNLNKLKEGEFESYAPNFMSDEAVEELHDEFKEQGEVDTFAREYLNQPIMSSEAAFQEEMFRYYNGEETPEKERMTEKELNEDPDVVNAILVDPARTTKMDSADSAIVGVGVNIRSNKIYVRDIDAGKFHPEELYDKVFDMARRIKARHVGLEVTGLHEYITYPFMNEVRRRAADIELVDLHARGGRNEKGKKSRVKSLVSFYRRGLVYHNKACTGGLEMQLLSFPRPQKWDIMDALGYLPGLLDSGEVFMRPYQAEYEEERSTVEGEYREIKRRTDSSMDWKRAV